MSYNAHGRNGAVCCAGPALSLTSKDGGGCVPFYPRPFPKPTGGQETEHHAAPDLSPYIHGEWRAMGLCRAAPGLSPTPTGKQDTMYSVAPGKVDPTISSTPSGSTAMCSVAPLSIRKDPVLPRPVHHTRRESHFERILGGLIIIYTLPSQQFYSSYTGNNT